MTIATTLSTAHTVPPADRLARITINHMLQLSALAAAKGGADVRS